MIAPILLLGVSIIAGFVGAMSGMGGGVVLVPILTLLGVDIKHAIAVSMLSVIATSSGSASAYVRDSLSNIKVGMFLEMFTIVGAIIGAMITVASAAHFIFVIFGVVLLGSWLALFMQRERMVTEVKVQDRLSKFLELDGSYFDKPTNTMVTYQGTRAHIGGPLMFLAGLIAGMLGIGAGALKVLIHDLVMGLPPKVSTTTSNFIIGVTALAGSSIYLSSGLIRPELAVSIVLGVVIGSLFGARVLPQLSNRAVRAFFLVVLLTLATEMILKGVGVL